MQLFFPPHSINPGIDGTRAFGSHALRFQIRHNRQLTSFEPTHPPCTKARHYQPSLGLLSFVYKVQEIKDPLYPTSLLPTPLTLISITFLGQLDLFYSM